MRLDELNLLEMSFEEFVIQEMEILDNLPRTREEYRKFTSKAVECFDGNILKLESDDVEGGV